MAAMSHTHIQVHPDLHQHRYMHVPFEQPYIHNLRHTSYIVERRNTKLNGDESW